MKTVFHQPEITNLRESTSREWLDTNGLGGYASGTVCNLHTRKYHGLLVAVLAQPPGSYVLLSQLEDWVEINDRRFAMVSHQYVGTVSPDGYTRQLRFEQEICPTFLYQCGELTVTRRVMMVQGANTVLIRYDFEGPTTGAVLRFRPLLAFRHVHQVTQANGTLSSATEAIANGFATRPYASMPRVCVQTNVKSSFSPDPVWYYRCEYSVDAERGFDHTEDLSSPGIMEVRLRAGQPVIVAASLEPVEGNLARAWQQEESRRAAVVAADAAEPAGGLSEGEKQLRVGLRQAARQFLITLPGDGPALHAGYHWFGPWGRDTLLALPGVAFLRGELELGARILTGFARLEQRGLLPNFVNPDGTGAYTTADASLWFFWTVQQYLLAGGSLETVRRQFWPVMLSIIRHFRAGTDNGILVDSDGLLRAGHPAMSVTWMDAQVGGRPIIPRWGYVVELNALWYNAVSFTLELSRKKFNEYVEDLDSDFGTRLQHAFVRRFWQADRGLLLDTVNEYSSDASVRPNAIFAVSLPWSPLSKEQQQAVVQLVKRDLFTPYGLRSLSTGDMRYRGLCQGEHWVRELAYHQGSVWPWFLAHFAEALFRAEGRTRENRALFTGVTGAFEKHMREAGIGSVSEVFDGDAPHLPRGAISQAWNVGELLRLLHLLGKS